MRVTTAFNRMLGLAGAKVASVTFTDAGIVIGIRNTSRRLRCECGWSCRARYDTAVRRWRHVNLGKSRVWLEGEIRRLACKKCGRVRTEDVAWARPSARHTRDFEDIVAWLVQRTDKTTTATLMGCSWQAVDNIVERVVAEHLVDDRLDNLYRIGVDEISYRRHHQYLTIVADHDGGGVVWIAKGKRGKALEDFYAELGQERRDQIEAVSMDLGAIYHHATRRCVPDAIVCFDPFHVIQIANRALDAVYKSTGRDHPSGVATGPGATPASPCEPAPNTSTTPNASSSTSSAATADASIERGSSKKNSATSTAELIRRSPVPTSSSGSPERSAAASGPSSTWPVRSDTTLRGSSPPSSSASPTPASKESTQRSASSNAAATATTPSKPLPL